ncbi:hypothetical protein [Nannocystis punicea]|uniref:Myxococcus cysteine-rich repeat-containing protein n=1 Tax=Nannocystis punicea TaxID=2995304 RepID=A0ABY7GZZ6_9BACT|nr:hypothetical protein [Nannocystis poenicansa]WAS92527.1 hypothetical protein O0S08_40625 [Nannocystis poenicansa]
MASPRLLPLLLVVAAACGDDGTASSSVSDSNSGDTTTATTSTSGATGSDTVVPTTGEAGSNSDSESETGVPTTGATMSTAVSASESGATETGVATVTDGTATTDTTGTSDATGTSDSSTTDTTSSSTTTGCVDACEDGDVQCVGDGAVHTCGVGRSGCLEWSEPEPCDADESCQDGECVVGCVDACDAGTSQCTGGGVSECVDDPMSGCTVWTDAAACGPNQVCQQGECLTPPPACLDDCVFTKQSVPGDVDFYSVWGSDAKAVWVVGASGTALYHNGVNWKSIDSGVGKRLECVHGSAADDVYAIASDGAIIRWDGLEWLPYADLNPIWESSACLSVLGQEDLLALVYDENGEKQVLYRVTGGVKTQLAVYTPQAVFTPDGSKARTISLRAFSADDAFITADRALRWNGTNIVNMAAPNPSFGLWALTPQFAYAAASHSGIGHRWDGQSWKIVNPGLNGYLHMFAGTATNRVFGVGESLVGVASIVAFDGIGWGPVATPADAKALFAAWAAPSGEVFAVGKAGTVLIGK